MVFRPWEEKIKKQRILCKLKNHAFYLTEKYDGLISFIVYIPGLSQQDSIDVNSKVYRSHFQNPLIFLTGFRNFLVILSLPANSLLNNFFKKMSKWGIFFLRSSSHIFVCSYLYLLNLFSPISSGDLYSQTQKLSLITRCLTWNIYKHRKIRARTNQKAIAEPVLTSHQQNLSPSHH